MQLLCAHDITGCRLVRFQGRLWLKAWRDSKDYVNHYLVEAKSAPDLALIYIDPETKLEALDVPPVPESLVPRPLGEAPCPGDLLVTGEERRLVKALDVKKDGQRHLAYVDIETGEIRPRQERGVARVYSGWEIKMA